ncbi:zinc-ribbon domain containing protein [Massilia sp. W12]|uniref:zinc-ribbon domain containing protein n=1 Tax=Massilia sp. W12 TaxID=3126507 RepID=UPI0030D181A7
MMKRAEKRLARQIKQRSNVALAEPRLWSNKSQQSVQAIWAKEYRDIHYHCSKCHAAAVFSAQDQKHSYEIKKAYIDQKRRLCHDCWLESLRIKQALQDYANKWHTQKNVLRTDENFLQAWLDLVLLHKLYLSRKEDTARINMIKRLLDALQTSKAIADTLDAAIK